MGLLFLAESGALLDMGPGDVFSIDIELPPVATGSERATLRGTASVVRTSMGSRPKGLLEIAARFLKCQMIRRQDMKSQVAGKPAVPGTRRVM